MVFFPDNTGVGIIFRYTIRIFHIAAEIGVIIPKDAFRHKNFRDNNFLFNCFGAKRPCLCFAAGFMDLYQRALFLPHTDAEQYRGSLSPEIAR